MRTLIIIVSIIAIVVFGATVASGQQELANPLVPQRLSLNMVKHVGEWTWFSIDGSLYRKHVNSGTAELWYGAVKGQVVRTEYRGLLLDPQSVAFQSILTPENSRMPSGFVQMRLEASGVLWLSDRRGTEVSFDGLSWRTHARGVPAERGLPRYTNTWSAATPFYGERLVSTEAAAFRPDETLLQSINDGSYNPSNEVYKPKAVFDFDVYPNGNVIILTHDGLRIFRPSNTSASPLAESEVTTGAPLRAVAPYPNPAGESVTFALENATSESNLSIEIRDLIGRERMLGIIGSATGTTVNISALDEGVYVAVLRMNGATTTTRFTVAR